MAEPVTTAEVEDVLSSIRRLVGETKRHEHKKEQAGTNDMLVLTQHLRVPDDRELLQPGADQAVADVAAIDAHEEPPLAVVAEAPEAPAPTEPLKLTEEVRLPTIEVKRTTETEFMDLSAKIAALETAIARTADQWEPDGAGRDAYAGTQPPAMEWREDVELDGTGRPLTQGQEEAQEEAADAEETLETALEEQVIDEDTLREMVAEIVRSELQGELGVRITRNVRTLVRREIHRALMAQKLT